MYISQHNDRIAIQHCQSNFHKEQCPTLLLLLLPSSSFLSFQLSLLDCSFLSSLSSSPPTSLPWRLICSIHRCSLISCLCFFLNWASCHSCMHDHIHTNNTPFSGHLVHVDAHSTLSPKLHEDNTLPHTFPLIVVALSKHCVWLKGLDDV